MLSSFLFVAFVIAAIVTVLLLAASVSDRAYYSSTAGPLRLISGATLCIAALAFGIWGALNRQQTSTGIITFAMVMIAFILATHGVLQIYKRR